MRQNPCIPGIVTRDLNRSDVQCLLVDTDVHLTPNASFQAILLDGDPFAFTLDLDPCAVDKKVQRVLRATILNVHRKRPLTLVDSAEVRHVPVQPGRSAEAGLQRSQSSSEAPSRTGLSWSRKSESQRH